MAADQGSQERKVPRALIWGGLGFVVVFAGIVGALWVLSPGGGRFDSPLPGVGGIFRGAEEEAMAPPGEAPGPSGPGVRSYRVQEGDNLWAIARKGTLVDEPWEWRTIMVQNRDKIDYAFLSESSGEWKVLIETGEELTVRAEPPVDPSQPVTKKYAIQLMTVPERSLDRALDVVKTLLADGHYGYLYRLDENGTRGYRVRVGFFETKLAAEQAAQGILAAYAGRSGYPEDYWVVVPSDRELRGQLLDFGAQRSKPWVIELPRHGTHGEALEELRKATGIGEFVYIAQGRGVRSAKFVYRTRIGFFETAAAAEQALASHRDRMPALEQARVVELKSLAETLPGQRFKTDSPQS